MTLEVAAREDARALDSVSAHFPVATTAADTMSSPARRVAEAVLTIALLPPGEYVARAVVSVGGRKTGRVVRPFRVIRSSTVVTPRAASRGRARSRGANPFTTSIDAFERSTVLTPQIVGFFLDRLSAGNRTAPPAAAVEHARAGRFEAALDAAKHSGHQLAAAFLQGMVLYARGDIEAAAVKFRDTLRVDSEFFPAVFYLGACYAAGGRDRDASAAWQTTLVGESDAPFIYTLLADALLRQREIDQAVAILNEAVALWPDDQQVQMRLGTALAMTGKPAEALGLLDAYLVKHPGDPERLFMALRVIYEAHAGGRTIGTAEEDRRRFDRYASAYDAAGGPQQALVEQWKKFMGRR